MDKLGLAIVGVACGCILGPMVGVYIGHKMSTPDTPTAEEVEPTAIIHQTTGEYFEFPYKYGGHDYFYRIRTPTGWLVSFGHGACFVPDEKGDWLPQPKVY